MKILIFFALCLVSATRLFADDTNNAIKKPTDAEINSNATISLTSNMLISSVVSKTNGGIFVFFCNEEGRDSKEFGSDSPVRYGFMSANKTYPDIFLLRSEYSCMIFAKSETGESPKPTKLGASYGTKYREVTGYDKDKLDISLRKGDSHPDHERPYMIMVAPYFSGMPRSLPAPEDLFVFNKPGKYKLSIEMQVFCSSSRSKSVYLVKFPAVELTIIKKEDPKK